MRRSSMKKQQQTTNGKQLSPATREGTFRSSHRVREKPRRSHAEDKSNVKCRPVEEESFSRGSDGSVSRACVYATHPVGRSFCRACARATRLARFSPHAELVSVFFNTNTTHKSPPRKTNRTKTKQQPTLRPRCRAIGESHRRFLKRREPVKDLVFEKQKKAERDHRPFAWP